MTKDDENKRKSNKKKEKKKLWAAPSHLFCF
jgi:hypothetical protein